MNIFWFLTDSICSYERKDKFGLLPIYKELLQEGGFFFDDVISLFPSTLFSVLSIITGRFPYYLFPDFWESPPPINFPNYFYYFSENGFNIYSFICFNIGAYWLKNIFNPVINTKVFKEGRQLNAEELFSIFLEYEKNINYSDNNIIFVHFRAGDSSVNKILRKFKSYLENKKKWKQSLIVVSSDHGYMDRSINFNLNPLHFDDIYITSFRPALFIKLPYQTKIVDVKKRIYTIDLWETIMDILKINISYTREAISFKDILLMKNINKTNYQDRYVRADAYLMFQPIKKTCIIKEDNKLNITSDKLWLTKIENKIYEKKYYDKKVFNDLKDFYYFTQNEAQKNIWILLEKIWNHSFLKNIKEKTVLIPKQFPPVLIEFIKSKLAQNNKIINPEKGEIADYLILVYNRLYGYGISKITSKLEGRYKKKIIIDSKMELIDESKTSIGYLNFIKREFKNRKKLIWQRPKDTLIWLLYYPLYLRKHLKKFY